MTTVGVPFHTRNQFKQRIGGDPDLLPTMWYDGVCAESEELYYDYLRRYEGELARRPVLMVGTDNTDPNVRGDVVIKTVFADNQVDYQLKNRRAVLR